MQAALGSVGSRPIVVHDGQAVGRWLVDVPTHQGIEAVRRILNAESVDLLRLERATGAIAVAVRGHSDHVQLVRGLHEAVAVQCDFMFTDHQPRWIKGWPDSCSMTLLARIVEREAYSYFLAARVANAPESRERTERLVPDLVRLSTLR